MSTRSPKDFGFGTQGQELRIRVYVLNDAKQVLRSSLKNLSLHVPFCYRRKEGLPHFALLFKSESPVVVWSDSKCSVDEGAEEQR